MGQLSKILMSNSPVTKYKLSFRSDGFSLLEVIASAAVLGMAISFSYIFANISEDVKSSSKLRNSVAEIVETDLEKFKSIFWGFLYVPNGTIDSNPCYRTNMQCINGTVPVVPDVIAMQKWCQHLSSSFLVNLPNSLKTTQYFYPDPQYHQIFQGRSARIQRKIELITHPIASYNNSTSFSLHRKELFKISYYLVAHNDKTEKIVLESFSSGQRPSHFFIRSYFLNLDAHASCPSKT